MQMADPTAGKVIPLRDYTGKIYEIVFPPPVWTCLDQRSDENKRKYDSENYV